METTAEVAAWYEALPPTERAQALDTGLAVLARGADNPVRLRDLSLPDAYVEAFGEYTVLAVAHARADERLGELEREEEQLRIQLARLRASNRGTPPAPAGTPADLTAGPGPSAPSRLRVTTRKVQVQLSPHQQEVLRRLAGATEPAAGETETLLNQALAYACATSVVAGANAHSDGLHRLVVRLRGRSAALNYELWAREYDSRVVQLHINALRAEIAFFSGAGTRWSGPPRAV